MLTFLPVQPFEPAALNKDVSNVFAVQIFVKVVFLQFVLAINKTISNMYYVMQCISLILYHIH